jgi:pimeloyl-ACP methyl ester carboxylesterase
MKELYLLSGLGADKRVFQYLNLVGHSINHVEWIAPHPNESIAQYAKRLLTQIPTENPTLIGVSFGGIMAIEIAKQIKTEKVIIISSTKTRQGIPFIFRLMGRLGLVKHTPSSLQKKVNRFTFWLFGTESEKEEEMLRTIINEMDSQFLLWAMDRLVNWKNSESPDNVIAIHGNKDRLFPHKDAEFMIENGGHLMLINKSGEISRIIHDIIGDK